MPEFTTCNLVVARADNIIADLLPNRPRTPLARLEGQVDADLCDRHCQVPRREALTLSDDARRHIHVRQQRPLRRANPKRPALSLARLCHFLHAGVARHLRVQPSERVRLHRRRHCCRPPLVAPQQGTAQQH
eukprot:7384816-Prymnesium_polylepis.1